MRFSLSSSALSTRLQTLAKVINSKNSMPILECFVFDVSQGQLRITASDGENRMTSLVSLSECDSEGSFAISSRLILDAVKLLPEQPLAFDVNLESYQVTVEYQNGQYQLVAQNAEEYPQVQPMEGDIHTLTIDAGVLVSNLSRTLFATDNNEIRPVMNGVFFDLTPEHLAIVASDGHKLVRCRNYDIKSETPASFILPKKPANLLKNGLDPTSGDVVIKFNSNAAELTFADGTLRCQLIEGTFPNYNAAIPADNPNELLVDRKALMDSIRRVLPFASISSQLIRFRLSMGSLQLSAEDIDFATSAKETLVCEYNGQPLQIGFRGDYFCEVLSSLDSDDVKVMLGDPSRPGIALPSVQDEHEDVLMLIMPLILNE